MRLGCGPGQGFKDLARFGTGHVGHVPVPCEYAAIHWIDWNISVVIWGFPKIGVPPSSHPFIDGIFHEINRPAIGVALFMKAPYQFPLRFTTSIKHVSP